MSNRLTVSIGFNDFNGEDLLIHSHQSWQSYDSRHKLQAWYDPARAKKVTFPHWRLLAEHLRSITQAPLGYGERMWCYLYMGWWMRNHFRYLTKNLLLLEP